MLSLSKHCFPTFCMAQKGVINASAGFRRAVMLGSVVSLAACGDLRPPIVWNGQTDDSEQNVVACLKRRVVFDKVAFVKVRAKAGSKATRTYILSSKVTLHFDHAKRDIDRIFVRADRELSQTEKNGLSRCARYPDNPISPLDPL